jgi:hypothetical protein
MTILVGFTALGVDVGMLFHAKRNVQIAADAAATAAAVDYLYKGSTTSAQAAGKAASTQNGITDGSGGASVTINTPPVYGPNAGASGVFEAIVTDPNPTIFMSGFSALFNQGASSLSSVTVAARAVAGVIPGTTCLYLTNASGAAFSSQGNATINASGCGIYVNSSSNDAMSTNGNSVSITAGYVNVAGGTESSHTPSGTPIAFNAGAISNPLNSVPNPTCTTTVSITSITGSTSVDTPGMNNAICFSNTVNVSGSATLTGPGVFVFQNGINIPTGATLATSNATVDISGGFFNQASNSQLNLSADGNLSDTYNGIALMVPASNTNYPSNPQHTSNELQVQFGSNNSSLMGIIYAPVAELFLKDNGGASSISCNAASSTNQQICTTIIAGSLDLGPSTLNIANYNSANPTTSPLRTVALVE